MVAAWLIGVGLSAIRAAAARDGLYDLDLFAGTGVLDKMPDVDDALEAGVGAFVLVVGGRVEGIAGWRYPGGVHSASPFLWAGPREILGGLSAGPFTCLTTSPRYRTIRPVSRCVRKKGV